MSESPWRTLLPGQVSRVCIFDTHTDRVSVVLENADVIVEAPNWHPRSNELVVNADGRLYRIAPGAAGLGEPVEAGTVTDANNDHVLSPDGSTAYISARDGHLYAAPLDGGQARRVSNEHPEPFAYYLHGVSPDGSTLAYIGHNRTEGTFDVYTVPAAGGPDTRVTVTRAHHDGAEYTRDGTRLLVNSERNSTLPGHSQLFSLALNGGDVRQLTTDERVNWFPHANPVTEQIVYLSYLPGTTGHPANREVELRLLETPDAHPRVLRTLLGGQGTINVNSWSPDGRYFAFVEYPLAADTTEPDPQKVATS